MTLVTEIIHCQQLVREVENKCKPLNQQPKNYLVIEHPNWDCTINMIESSLNLDQLKYTSAIKVVIRLWI